MKGRDLRAVVVGGLFVATAWTALRGIPGGMAFLERLEESTEQRAEVVERGYDRLAELPRLSDSLGRLQEAADGLPRMLLAGGDADAASLDLVSRVRSTMEEYPVTLEGFEDREQSEVRGPLSLAAVTVTFESDFRGVLETLHALEADSAIAVDSMHVEDQRPHASESDLEVLAASVVVSGWFASGTMDGRNRNSATASGSNSSLNDLQVERSSANGRLED